MPGDRPLIAGFDDLAVLLAEDESFTRQLAVSCLNRIGVKAITTAANGLDALKIVDSSQPIDLIISDWAMPQMTGLDLLRLSRNVRPQIPFLMLTGHADLDLVKAARTHRVDGYIVKPFSVDQLKTKIAAIFRIRS